MSLRRAVPALLMGFAAGEARAQDAMDPSPPDTGAWACRFCPQEQGASGWIEPAGGYVSDSSYRFGDYTGLEDRGGFASLDGAWRYRGADSGQAWDVSARRWGVDAQAFAARGGRQGSYRLSLQYEALPHLLANDGRTPFTGGDSLGLPAGWSTGGSTGGMSALDASLHRLALRQERERSAIGVALTPHPLADVSVNYRRDEIRGTGAVGASFMTLASQLSRPVNQTLDRIDASASLAHARGHAQLALESSFFSNEGEAVAWQNPYNPPTPGATTGQMAAAPDNSAHRLSLTLGTSPTSPLQLTGYYSIGQLRQNERFLPATVNPDETVALPRTSLDARVDTRVSSLRASYPVGRGLRLAADVLRDVRDNQTPVDAYTQVVMDTFTGNVRTNTPYGFTRNRWRFSVERRTNPRVSAGVDDDRRERQLHGTGRTVERRYWSRLGWRPFEGADLRMRLSHAGREGSEYTLGAGAPAQNPGARAYNTAKRRRNEARGDLSLGGGLMTGSFNVTYARDEYPETAIGRTAGREFGYGSDLMVQPVETLSLSASASRRRQRARQAGSQGFGAPDWFADQEDVTNVLGMHLEWQAPRGISVGADYSLSTSEGTIAMLTGGAESGFPLLVTRWHEARLFGRYPLRPDLSLRLDLLREMYRARDWTLDGVDPDTVANLLALGQGAQDGAVTAVLLGLRYEFAAASAAD